MVEITQQGNAYRIVPRDPLGRVSRDDLKSLRDKINKLIGEETSLATSSPSAFAPAVHPVNVTVDGGHLLTSENEIIDHFSRFEFDMDDNTRLYWRTYLRLLVKYDGRQPDHRTVIYHAHKAFIDNELGGRKTDEAKKYIDNRKRHFTQMCNAWWANGKVKSYLNGKLKFHGELWGIAVAEEEMKEGANALQGVLL